MGQVNITLIPNPGYNRIVPTERLIEGFSGRDALAYDGNTLLAGVSSADSTVRRVYAFERDAGSGLWSQTQVIEDLSSSRFGSAVALDGDFAIVAGQQVIVALRRTGGAWAEIHVRRCP